MTSDVLLALRAGGKGRLVVDGAEVKASRVLIVAEPGKPAEVRITVLARRLTVIAQDSKVTTHEAI